LLVFAATAAGTGIISSWFQHVVAFRCSENKG
jgi:hypothetical protein